MTQLTDENAISATAEHTVLHNMRGGIPYVGDSSGVLLLSTECAILYGAATEPVTAADPTITASIVSQTPVSQTPPLAHEIDVAPGPGVGFAEAARLGRMLSERLSCDAAVDVDLPDVE